MPRGKYERTPKICKAIGLGQTGKKLSNAHRESIRASLTGKKRSAAACNAISLGQIGKIQSPEHNAASAFGRTKYPGNNKNDRYFRRYYGITEMQYHSLHTKQHGLCAICGQPETYKAKSGKIGRLAVDHDHATGAVRGLLCSRCNFGIGYFRDSIEKLEKAIAYIKRNAI